MEEVLDEVDEVDADEEAEAEEEGGEPELSCLINSAARSAYSSAYSSSSAEKAYQAIENRHQMRRDLKRKDTAVHNPQSANSINPIPRINDSTKISRHHSSSPDRMPI